MRNHQRVSCRLICLEAMKIAEECGKAGELDATSQYVHKFGLAEEVLASQQFQSSCYDDRLPKKPSNYGPILEGLAQLKAKTLQNATQQQDITCTEEENHVDDPEGNIRTCTL